jgi:hypothetical protein
MKKLLPLMFVLGLIAPTMANCMDTEPDPTWDHTAAMSSAVEMLGLDPNVVRGEDICSIGPCYIDCCQDYICCTVWCSGNAYCQ